MGYLQINLKSDVLALFLTPFVVHTSKNVMLPSLTSEGSEGKKPKGFKRVSKDGSGIKRVSKDG